MNSNDFSIPTRVGFASDGENYYMGHALAGDLMKKEVGFWSLMSLSVGHRLLTQSEERQLADLAVSINAADPRIWPHKLVRLAAAYGQVGHTIAAVNNFSQGALVGPWGIRETASLFHQINLTSATTDLAVAIASAVSTYTDRKLPIPGFGTPMRKQDERCVALRESRSRQGFVNGQYWDIFESVTQYVESHFPVKVNAAAPSAAVFLDLGFSVEQVTSATIALVMPTWLAHASEGATQAPPVLQCLPDHWIEYQGPELRLSPRAIARRDAR